MYIPAFHVCLQKQHSKRTRPLNDLELKVPDEQQTQPGQLTRGLEVLSEGDVLVRCARGRVHNQVVQRPPVHVLQKLLDEPVFPRAPPHHGVVLVGEHEANGHHSQVVLNRGTPQRSRTGEGGYIFWY